MTRSAGPRSSIQQGDAPCAGGTSTYYVHAAVLLDRSSSAQWPHPHLHAWLGSFRLGAGGGSLDAMGTWYQRRGTAEMTQAKRDFTSGRQPSRKNPSDSPLLPLQWNPARRSQRAAGEQRWRWWVQELIRDGWMCSSSALRVALGRMRHANGRRKLSPVALCRVGNVESKLFQRPGSGPHQTPTPARGSGPVPDSA